MRTCKYDANILKEYIKKEKMVTMEEMKKVLETDSRATVFRKLNKFNYISSCSHRGKYYTLSNIPNFNKNGLWEKEDVLFSKAGNLHETTFKMIEESKRGYTVKELNKIIGLEVKAILKDQINKKEIVREKINGVYTYFSSNLKIKGKQKKENKLKEIEKKRNLSKKEEFDFEIKALIILFDTLLNEKQRRIFAGLESLKIGHGGDKKVAEILGIDPHTVSKGREELLANNDLGEDKVRKKGGGRKSIKKKLLK